MKLLRIANFFFFSNFVINFKQPPDDAFPLSNRRSYCFGPFVMHHQHSTREKKKKKRKTYINFTQHFFDSIFMITQVKAFLSTLTCSVAHLRTQHAIRGNMFRPRFYFTKFIWLFCCFFFSFSITFNTFTNLRCNVFWFFCVFLWLNCPFSKILTSATFTWCQSHCFLKKSEHVFQGEHISQPGTDFSARLLYN